MVVPNGDLVVPACNGLVLAAGWSLLGAASCELSCHLAGGRSNRGKHYRGLLLAAGCWLLGAAGCEPLLAPGGWPRY